MVLFYASAIVLISTTLVPVFVSRHPKDKADRPTNNGKIDGYSTTSSATIENTPDMDLTALLAHNDRENDLEQQNLPTADESRIHRIIRTLFRRTPDPDAEK
ncbi:hypothetical protein K438DRAFT_1779495 [Mycena galopus ATCC 62051]|nr:hypothetical protein K438DRAFT_1779495 [Mycena galopus ATCC 62051]